MSTKSRQSTKWNHPDLVVQFVKVDTKWYNGTADKKIYDTARAKCVPGAVPGVGFKLIDSLLCLPSEFEDHTFCMVEYFKILPLSVSGPKIAYIQSIEIRLFGVFLYIKRSKKESTKSK